MKNHYGVNTQWLLEELASFDDRGITEGSFDVVLEGESGVESFAEVSVTKLAESAAAIMSQEDKVTVNRDDLEEALIWLQSALECKEWVWDVDQGHCATMALLRLQKEIYRK